VPEDTSNLLARIKKAAEDAQNTLASSRRTLQEAREIKAVLALENAAFKAQLRWSKEALMELTEV
jgi:hypothetical protein